MPCIDNKDVSAMFLDAFTNMSVKRRAYRKPREQLFLNRRPLNYPSLTKYMETYIRCKQQKFNTKTLNTTEVSPWNDQLYRITRWLYRFYRRLSSPSATDDLYQDQSTSK